MPHGRHPAGDEVLSADADLDVCLVREAVLLQLVASFSKTTKISLWTSECRRILGRNM